MTDPARSDRPSRPSGRTRPPAVQPWLVALVASFSTALWIVAAANGVRYVDVGADFAQRPDDTLVVIRVRMASSLRPGDRVVYVEGQPDGEGPALRAGEGPATELLRRIRFGPKRGTLRLEILRDGQRVATELPRARFVTPFGVAVSAAAFGLSLCIGVALALARTGDVVPRFLLFYLPLHGIALGGPPLLPPVAPLDTLGDATLFLGITILRLSPGLVLSLMTVFPTRLALPRWVVPAVLIGFSFVPTVWSLANYSRPMEDGAAWSAARGTWLNLASVLAAFVRLLHSAFTLPEGEARAGARIVILPACASVAGHLLIVGIPVVRNVPPPISPAWDALLALLVPLSFGVAVSRRKLFEIDRLIRRSAGYLLASGLLLAVFLLTAPGIASLVAGYLPPGTRATHAVAGLVAVCCFVLLNPLRRRTQAVLDRLFYRQREDPGRLIASVFAAAAHSGSWKEAVDGLLEKTAAALHPEFQRIWIFGEGSALLPEPPSGGPSTLEPALSEAPTGPRSAPVGTLELDETRVVECLGAFPGSSQPLTPAELRVSSAPVADALADAGVALVVPILGSGGSALGLWALGEKKSEETYAAEELSALTALAGGLSFAVERERLASRVAFEQKGRRGLLARLARSGHGMFAECPRCGRCFDEESVCPEDGATAAMIHGFPRHLAERYRLEQRLGAGGMGVVFRARDGLLRRDVAVKLIREEHLSTDTSLARFRREARLAARLAHPNAVTVYDAGELPGIGAYYVMELLEGRTLAREISRRVRIPWPEAIDLLSDVLDALAAAHAIGLVHRDVKPGNVFLVAGRERRQAKLMDFGLALSVTADSPSTEALTRSGALLGTPGYIAPELARGESASPASDLWAVGVIAYEMLAGERPFTGKSALDMLDRARWEDYRSLPLVAPQLPIGLCNLVHAALAADPARRPATAAVMRESLQRALRTHAPF